MHWLQDLDLGLLRFINQTLSNQFFDTLMPFASGNAYFFPAVFLAGILLLWKGGTRGRLCILMLALIVGPGDGLITNNIKHSIERPRPFVTHDDIRLPASKAKPTEKAVEEKQAEKIVTARAPRRSGYNSMPSAHAANWFAVTMIFFVYFRRSLWIFLPLACVISFSRLYNGVHYPSDVLTGAILGAGYAAAGLWLINALWQRIGREWFPLWFAKLPSLTNPQKSSSEGVSNKSSVPAASQNSKRQTTSEIESRSSDLDRHWLRVGYALIAILFIVQLFYIGSDAIELSGDEAYQWIWSKHLALSYYSKPLMIALTQWLGTHLWGDTAFGVRFFSPVLAGLSSLLLLRFLTPFTGGRAAVLFLLVSATTPLLALGSTLMTVDPLSVFFWILAMLAGWRAAQPNSKTSDWLWVGLWMGLGFLSKYTALFQLLCWAVFFALWKPSRIHLRRSGPYLALLVNALCTLPVIIWNAQHHWITATHVAGNAGLHGHWKPRVLDFLGVEAGLLNPFYFIGAAWAGIAMWRSLRRNAFAVYLFSMGAPLFLCYFLWSFHSRILPNWIAPSVLPLFCLMIVFWNERWPQVKRWAKPTFIVALVLGGFFVVLLHDTDIVKKIAGRPLPPKPDPLTRVRAYSESARIVNQVREQLLAEGKPVFIICSHYQSTGLMTFYIPEARTNVNRVPLVYAQREDVPENQFYFWPGYKEQRRGQNAIYVRELGAPSLVDGWVGKWLKGASYPSLLSEPPRSGRIPKNLLEDFESVKDLGQFEARYRGRVFHTYQILECRNLR